MRPILLAVSFAAILLPQEQAPIGVLRGRLLSVIEGSLSLRTLVGVSYRCGFDSHTYMENEGTRIFAGALRTDDLLELITDRKAGACYARTVRVVPPTTRVGAQRPYRNALDYLFPRGNLTFAGVVRRFNGRLLVLRTRDEAEKMILLREDTRFLQSGFPVDASHLAINARVFIRGGKNIENDLEAYQVIWGEIPGPKHASLQ